ncbi:hypothetical protein KY362_01325 [Candidatus Woesearchaeota archaeon]|nr:hypothetical protein [Candidatus Woesearchaeota archaeon]
MLFGSGLSYMLTYICTLVFAFLGVYVGALLAYMAPDELKPGKLYFRALMNTILVLVPLFILYAYNANIFVLILLGVVATIFLYFTSETSPVNQVAYFLLGIAFFFSTRSVDLFIIVSALIFLYGLPLGSLYVSRRLKKSKRTVFTDMLLNFGLFVIIALMTNLVALYMANW